MSRGNLRLAVTAPRGVELEENILLVVDHKLLVRVGNDNSDRTFLSLGNGLRLDARLNLAVQDVLDELADILSLELLVLVIRILGVLGGVLDGEGRELFGVKVEVSSVGAEHGSVDSGNVDGTLVLLSDGLELLSELLTLLLGLGEDVGEGDTSLMKWLELNFFHREKHNGLLLTDM